MEQAVLTSRPTAVIISIEPADLNRESLPASLVKNLLHSLSIKGERRALLLMRKANIGLGENPPDNALMPLPIGIFILRK